MDSEVLVKVDNVSKKFCRNLKRSLWYGVKDIGTELLAGKVEHEQLRKDEFWAVKDVSFELRRGECLGLIGHNGAGKSTLLKMLNGLIKPDKGTITMKGRIGALIELGAGFNPILTGRENVYINGQILGFSKKEIDAKLNDIIEFAEIGDFIDTPVQNYSSGMKVRLGFAVASRMTPDVLILDEVLAVGDVSFQVKCFNAIEELVKNAAVIFVSHNMPQIAKIASYGLFLEKGTIKLSTSNLSQLITTYYDITTKTSQGLIGLDFNLNNLAIKNSDGNEINDVEYFDDITIEFSFIPKIEISETEIIVVIFDRALRPIAFVSSETIAVDEKDSILIKIEIPKIQLSIGRYELGIQFSSKSQNNHDRRKILSYYKGIKTFNIVGDQPINHAFFQLQGDWKIDKKSDE